MLSWLKLLQKEWREGGLEREREIGGEGGRERGREGWRESGRVLGREGMERTHPMSAASERNFLCSSEVDPLRKVCRGKREIAK